MLSQITDVPNFPPPPIDRRGLGEVEATLAKDPVVRFVVAVLPRASGLDEVRVGGAFR